MLENPIKSIVYHVLFDGNHPKRSEDISGYRGKCPLESPAMVVWKVWLQLGVNSFLTHLYWDICEYVLSKKKQIPIDNYFMMNTFC